MPRSGDTCIACLTELIVSVFQMSPVSFGLPDHNEVESTRPRLILKGKTVDERLEEFREMLCLDREMCASLRYIESCQSSKGGFDVSGLSGSPTPELRVSNVQQEMERLFGSASELESIVQSLDERLGPILSTGGEIIRGSDPRLITTEKEPDLVEHAKSIRSARIRVNAQVEHLRLMLERVEL